MNKGREIIRIVMRSLPLALMIFFAAPSGAQHVMDLNQVPPDFKVRGPGNDYFGFSLASGDVNGDGIDDLLIGDPAVILRGMVLTIW